ncbi:MAG: YceI family protein [Blastocatellia bacterium]|nr:YceI family protein [Blastocatellia bacterium]
MEATSNRYKLEAEKSRFTVQAYAAGFLAGLGHHPTIGIQDFDGEARFSPGASEEASLRLRIRAGSLVVLGEMKEKDREEIRRTMFEKVLEIASYPEIDFESTQIALFQISTARIAEGRYKARIIGTLTLHGVTQPGVWIMALITLDGETLRAQGSFMLKQTDYGIKLVSVAGGALRLKDDLKFTFDLIGHREN